MQKELLARFPFSGYHVSTHSFIAIDFFKQDNHSGIIMPCTWGILPTVTSTCACRKIFSDGLPTR